MYVNFVPSFHFDDPATKLKPEWCRKSLDYYWYGNNIRSLLWNKRVELIEEFYTGDIKMDRFRSMFKSMKDKHKQKLEYLNRYLFDGERDMDLGDLIFEPYPIIQDKVKTAISLIEKIPTEITCTANDALAMDKKKQDIEFLQNKPLLENDLQPIADQLGIGSVDLGSTKNSYGKYSDTPFGLDLSDPQDQKVFADLIYALRVEVAMEKVLTQFKDVKKYNQIRLLETRDQYKYAISCNRVFRSNITGMPDAEYVWPGDVLCADSKLPDFSDNSARFVEHRMTVMEAFNMLGGEISDLEDLERIMNGVGGYCQCNHMDLMNPSNFWQQKICMVYCEVKTVDYVGIYENPKSKKGFATFTSDPKKMTSRIWAQNTVCFWWLRNTNYCYQIHRLDGAQRKAGIESYQSFSTNIYKSAQKSAVELSVGQNIKAQIAEIKLNFAVLMAKADGWYVDIRGMRNAIKGLKDAGTSWTTQTLLQFFTERNQIIADTEGFDGKNDGQFKPVIPIEGGVRNIDGYLKIQEFANNRIDQFIGTNPTLTGMSQNPDALIGVEKLRIDASLNALYYVTEAIEEQQKKMFNMTANFLQAAIKEGGQVRKGIENYLCIDDVELLAGLNEIPLHQLTIKISLVQREQERALYQQRLQYLIAQGAITIAEEYMISAISNPKERFAQLARIENRYKEQQKQKEQELYQQQQTLQKQRNDGMVASENAATEGKIKQEYAKGDVQSKILQLGHQLGLNASQIEFLQKRALQQDRGQDQFRKAIGMVREKQTSELLKPLTLTT